MAGQRILVIEDDVGVADLIRDTLFDPDLEIEHEFLFWEGKQRLQNQAYDLALIDLALPDGDGLDLIAWAVQRFGVYLPVIALGEEREPDAVHDCFNRGAFDFIEKPIRPRKLKARVRTALGHREVVRELTNAESVLFSLGMILEEKSSNASNHCRRLAELCRLFGEFLKCSGDEISALKKGSFLHDLGMVAVPGEQMNRPRAEWSDAEWALYKTHPMVGEALCAKVRLLSGALPLIRSHHEMWDGSGFPDGLRGQEIPYLVRVFTMCEFFDHSGGILDPDGDWSRFTTAMQEKVEKGKLDPELSAKFLRFISLRRGNIVSIAREFPALAPTAGVKQEMLEWLEDPRRALPSSA